MQSAERGEPPHERGVLNIIERPAAAVPRRSFVSRARTALADALLRLARAFDARTPHEPALSDSERDWLTLVARHPGIAVAITDDEHRILWVNEAFTRTTGLSERQAKGRTPGQLLFFSGTDVSTVQRARAAFASRSGTRFEVLVRTGDGRERWLETDVQPRLNASGKTEGYISIVRDVTEQVRVREEMRVSENRMRTMIEGANLGTWEADVRSPTVTVNAAFSRMLGYEPGELTLDPRTLRELCHPDDRAATDRGARAAVAGEASGGRGQYRLRAKDGSWRWVLGAAGVLERASDGAPLRLFGVQVDVTEQRFAQEERQRVSEHLAAIAANLPIMTFQMRLGPDGRGAFLYASPAVRNLLGVEPEDLMRDPAVLRFADPEEQTAHRAAQLQSAASLTPWFIAHSVQRPDGEVRWVEGDAIPQRAPDGSTIWTGYLADVTPRRIAEQQLRVSEEKLRSLYDLSPLGIALCDASGRFLQTNYAMEAISGYPQSELAASSWPQLAVRVGGGDPRQRLAELMQSGRFGPIECELTRKGGSRIPVQLTGIMVTASDGARLMWTMVEDIADRKRAEERISFLAYHDALTGLDNRYGLRRRLAEAQALAAATRSRLAVMIIDLDRFKSINDMLGHETGDRVIGEVARRIRAAVRDTDIVARLGGDEFVVVLGGLRADAQIERIAAQVCEQLRGEVRIDGRSVHVTGSAGVAVFPQDGSDEHALMRKADVAMYVAKSQGRDAWRIYHPSMTQASDQRISLEAELRGALAAGQFVLHYQPQMDTLTGRPTGVEALLRWNHPERGLISPALFIPIAEETRLIEPIGEWVLAAACRDMRAWLDQGGERLTLAVNLSAVQLAREDLAERLAGILAATGLPPELLELELTESAAMGSPDAVGRCLARLKTLGVSLAIDDFGTGHSSLARLKMFNVDRLKIDRTIVTDCVADAYDSALCKGTIALGRALGLEVVAEGVETQEQWQFLAQEHCNSVQGFLFARPMPAAELFAFLRSTLATPRLRVVRKPDV